MIPPHGLSFRRVLGTQLVVGLVAAIAGWLTVGPQLGASIAGGAGLMWLNLLALGWTWSRVFQKKSIAWTSLIIVIKYAVLLISIFYLVHLPGFSSLGAGLGVSSFVITALLLSLGLDKPELKFF